MKLMKRLLAVCLTLLLLCSLTQMSFATKTPPYKGIDVSRWQGAIDWAKVKSSGVDFAILRCYASQKDPSFDTYYAGATAQGIPVGAYVYMYATTEDAAIKEAQNTLAALGRKPLTFPLFLDVENRYVMALGKTKITDLMLIELNIFAAAGYLTGIYASLSQSQTHMDANRLKGQDWWIARWTCYSDDYNKKTFLFSAQDPMGSKRPECTIWQFSNGGKGDAFGIGEKYVDLNYCYKDYISNGPQTPNKHRFQIKTLAATCTQPGRLRLNCSHCALKLTMPYTASALGHTAPNSAGKCTRCGVKLPEPQVEQKQPKPSAPCLYCGKIHSGAFGRTFWTLHRILSLFKK